MQFWENLFKYKKRSLYFKLFIKISLPVMFLIVATCTVIIAYINNNTHQKLVDNAQKYTDTYVSLLENTMTECKKLSILLATNDDIRYFVSNTEDINRNHDNLLNTYEKLNIYKMTYQYIDSIYVYSENKNLILSGNTLVSADKFDDMNWLLENFDDNGIYVVKRLKCSVFPVIFSFVKTFTVGDARGAVVVNCNVKTASEIFKKNADTYIIDDGGIVFSGAEFGFNMPFKDNKVLKQYNPCSKKFVNGKAHISGSDVVIIDRSENFDWYYCTVSNVSGNGGRENIIIILCVLIGVCIGLAVIYYVLSSTSKSLEIFDSVIKNPQSLDNGAYKTAPAEVKEIADEIFMMMQHNYEIRNQLEKRLSNQKKYQIAALQAQLNPHFLYNALNNIYLQIIDDFDNLHGSAKMTLMLSNMMRYSMRVDTAVVTVHEDLKYAGWYVDMMREKYPNIFVNFAVPEKFYNRCVVRITFQPVIENAYKHAFSQGKGTVDVTGYETENYLIFEVSDDGAGIAPDTLLKIRENLENVFADESGIGIVNLNSRMRLAFGDEYGIEINSKSGEGTKITMKFPKNDKEKEI